MDQKYLRETSQCNSKEDNQQKLKFIKKTQKVTNLSYEGEIKKKGMSIM